MYVVSKQIEIGGAKEVVEQCVFFLIIYFPHFAKTIEGQVICSKGLCEFFSQNSSHFS